MNSSRPWPFRYDLVDGFRGIAALTVVAGHSGLVGIGRYAVMAFFVISGYCIAASAENCRRNNLSFGAFMARRLHRIYPPYLLAIVFYVLTRVIKLAMGGPNDLHRPVLDWVMNLTMTQWVWLVFHPMGEAVQNPKLLVAAFWSLNYEDQFYLVMAAALVLASWRRIPMIVTVTGLTVVGLAWISTWPGPWVTGLFIEYWPHFAVGVALFHVLCLSSRSFARPVFVVATIALGSWCLYRILPWQPDTLVSERAFVELGTASGFALLLFGLRPLSEAISRHLLWKPFAALGAISYSLYLIHQFNLTLVASIVSKLEPAAGPSLGIVSMVGLQVLLATAFWYCCERPFLNRKPSQANAKVTPGQPSLETIRSSDLGIRSSTAVAQTQ